MHSIEFMTREFLSRLQSLYFEQRDFDAILPLLDPGVVWIGAEQQPGMGPQDALARLKAESDGLWHRFSVADSRYALSALADDCCLAQGRLELRSDGSCPARRSLHLTAICRARGDRVGLLHLHLSASDAGAAAPHRGQERDSRDFQALTDNLPGGALCCLDDAELTIRSMSDGFLSLFGFTRDEVASRFAGRYLGMVHPEDRGLLRDAAARHSDPGTTIELEYRAVTGDGRVIWLLDRRQLAEERDKRRVFYCFLLDVSDSKRAREELCLALERHQIVMDQTADIIFEWDLHSDSITYSPNWAKRFGYEPLCRQTGDLTTHSHLHPDDTPLLLGIMQSMRDGVSYGATELRIADRDGRYLWCRVRATSQCDAAGRPFKAVGVIIDIDAEKRLSMRLMERAERDALTGLYNKMAVQAQIEALLAAAKRGVMSAMMIIDIDNFKQVNDTMGHLAGDALLGKIAGELKKLFRNSDVVGRVGGDEFMVFLGAIPDAECALQKAESILRLLNGSTPRVERRPCHPITCSIGIALHPRDGMSFQELYRHADLALYSIKRRGKNGCALYERAPAPFGPSDQLSSVNETIDSNRSDQVLSSRLVEYVFRILYRSLDVEAAIPLILEIIGRQFDVSRTYIFEASADGRHFSNTFEWCAEGVASQMSSLQELPLIGPSHDYFSQFEKDLFCCVDIAQLPEVLGAFLRGQEIVSLLQYAARDGGRCGGFVGFDECRTPRQWTREQIEVLRFVSEVMATFLFKKRAQDRMARHGGSPDGPAPDQWTFVVDAATYELLYLSHAFARRLSEGWTGRRCYELLTDRDSPCEDCPAARLANGAISHSQELYHPALKTWSLVDAALIDRPDGRSAYLMTCRDITSYQSLRGMREAAP